MEASLELPEGAWELDDDFTGLADADGFMTVAGFGSLLSERSSRSTFPHLRNFRPGRVRGFRRMFAHQADIFHQRGIANVETGEVCSLSAEPAGGSDLVVSLFEVEAARGAVAAFIAREHEFRFVAVPALQLDGAATGRHAVLCCAYTDEEYFARRCPPEEFARRWARWGVARVWGGDPAWLRPCRLYLRHCVLAARDFCPEAYDNFLSSTVLADRTTLIRDYLERHPSILLEQPPPELAQRYNG